MRDAASIIGIMIAAMIAVGIYWMVVIEPCEPIRIARVIELGGCR
jgi:hypothetical protein